MRDSLENMVSSPRASSDWSDGLVSKACRVKHERKTKKTLTRMDHGGRKASAAFMPTISQQQKTMPAAFVRLRDKELSAANKVDDIRPSCPLLKCQSLT